MVYDEFDCLDRDGGGGGGGGEFGSGEQDIADVEDNNRVFGSHFEWIN